MCMQYQAKILTLQMNLLQKNIHLKWIKTKKKTKIIIQKNKNQIEQKTTKKNL